MASRSPYVAGYDVNVENNVGMFGPMDGDMQSFKTAAEYALDAKEWAELILANTENVEQLLAQTAALYAQGAIQAETITQLQFDFQNQSNQLAVLITQTQDAIQKTEDAAQYIIDELERIKNELKAVVVMIPPDDTASASFDPATLTFTFFIPQGRDGSVTDLNNTPIGVPDSSDIGFYVNSSDNSVYKTSLVDIANLVPSIRGITFDGGVPQTGVVEINKALLGLGNVLDVASYSKAEVDTKITPIDDKLINVDNKLGMVDTELTEIRNELEEKAPLISPALTGNPTAPTASQGDDSASVATTSFVKAAIDVAGDAYLEKNTNGNDIPDKTLFRDNIGVTFLLAEKAPLISPSLTGTPTAPTPISTDSSTAIATTAFVKEGISSAGDSYLNKNLDGADISNKALFRFNAGITPLLDLKAPLLSPALTGIPTTPTMDTSNVSTAIANTAFVSSVMNRSQVLRLTLIQAKNFTTFVPDQVVFISDLGYLFKFKESRNILEGQSESLMSVDDELHKLVDSGGMLEFCDYEKLRNVETVNYVKYLSKLKTNSNIQLVAYGDSITFGLDPSGGQYSNNYPTVISQVMTNLTQSSWSSQNKAFSGDRALTNYLRNINDGTTGDISTIMLGINDIKYSTGNGENPSGIQGDSLYGVKNYTIIMRKFAARELLRGRCVTILGTTQWIGPANSSPLGGFSECYLSPVYDEAARGVAEEFGCGYIDTKRDILQQFGISESCHDGIHLRTDFLPIFGRRLASFFLQLDYKNPCKLGANSVMIPSIFFQPISSSSTFVNEDFLDGSSPPMGGADNNPQATGLFFKNGSSITMAFYLDSDSSVIYPSINSQGASYSFSLLLDDGAKQPDYPSDVNVLLKDRQYILSQKDISGSTKKNRTTENYSQIYTACYLHVTTRGWHSITFSTNSVSGDVAIEGLFCDSWSNVRNNDVYGGVSGSLFRSGATNETTGFVTGCDQVAVGVFDVYLGNLDASRYRVDVEFSEDASLIFSRVIYKQNTAFRVQFYDITGAAVTPTSFRLIVSAGR